MNRDSVWLARTTWRDASIRLVWLLATVVALGPASVAQEPERVGAVAGIVLDREGRPALAGWTITVDPVLRDENASVRPRASASDRGDGTFHIADLRPGIHRLQLYAVNADGHSSRFWAHLPTVTVEAGKTTELEVLFSAAQPASIEIQLWTEGELPFVTPSARSFLLTGESLEPMTPQHSDDPYSCRLAFRGLSDGAYTLAFDQDGYAPRRMEGLRPRSAPPYALRMSGTCMLDITVEDAESGQRVERFAIEASVGTTRTSDTERLYTTPGHLTRMKAHPAGRLRATQLVPGDYTLGVTADGYQEEELDVADVRPGEARSIVVRLRRPASIAGIVITPAGEPVPHVFVGAYEPASEEGANDRTFHTLTTDWNILQPGPWVHSERIRTVTDAAGRFTLDGVARGRWIVRAYRSPTVHAVQRDVIVGDGTHVGDLHLELPEGRWIEGDALLPDGARCDDMSVRAWQIDGEVPVSLPMPDVPVAADGSFRIGPFAPGDVSLWLRVEPGFVAPANSSYVPGAYDPPLHDIGRVSIPEDAGSAAVTVDLREDFPASVRLLARRDGVGIAGAWVHLVDAATGEHLATAIADVDGRALLGPFFVTEARAQVSDPAGEWFAYSAATVRPAAADVGELSMDVSVEHGRLDFTDEAGRALADEIVCVYAETPFGWWPRLVRTDAEGALNFTMPPRRLRFLHVGTAGEWMMSRDGAMMQRFFGDPPYPPQPDEDMPLVDWTTVGPVPAVIALALREDTGSAAAGER